MKTLFRSWHKWSLKIQLSKKDWVQSCVIVSQVHLTPWSEKEFQFDILKLEEITKFQQKVYKTLMQVPCGSTITYGELAKKVGTPGAARAVGTAMAKNPVPVYVPCHRVVRADGTFGSFSGFGGAQTKKEILKLEQNGNLSW